MVGARLRESSITIVKQEPTWDSEKRATAHRHVPPWTQTHSESKSATGPEQRLRLTRLPAEPGLTGCVHRAVSEEQPLMDAGLAPGGRCH